MSQARFEACTFRMPFKITFTIGGFKTHTHTHIHVLLIGFNVVRLLS